MRTFLKIFIVIIILAAIFIVSTPASVIDSNLAKATQEQWRIAGASGTIWRGSGVLTHAPNTIIAPLQWRFEPSALLKGAARWRLTGEQETPSINATLTASRKGIEIEGLQLNIFASSLQSFFPKEIVQTLDGRLELDSPKLLLDERNQNGQVRGNWREANITLYDTPIALGDVAFSMDANDQGRSGTVHNQGGAVQLEGNFSSSAPSSLKVTPRADASPEVLQLLSTMAHPDASGAYVLHLR